jgi:ABC-type Zn uptake system ZnuABC Zn-binding protein ZnuA
MAREQLTKEQEAKLLIVVALLPVIADFIEDIPLYQKTKKNANMFIDEVRKIDDVILKGVKLKVIEEQLTLQREFRVWIKENFLTGKKAEG